MQWSMRLEGEEVKAVALGTPWVAAITSFNFLRIFTEGGLQVCQINIITILLHDLSFIPILGWGGEGGGGLKLLVFELWIMILFFHFVVISKVVSFCISAKYIIFIVEIESALTMMVDLLTYEGHNFAGKNATMAPMTML